MPSKRPDSIILAGAAFLLLVAFAGPASAIFTYCSSPGSCDSNPNARCTANGEGNCPSFCYMTCSEWAQCSGLGLSAQAATDDTRDLGLSVELFGTDYETHLRALSHTYGPCLVIDPMSHDSTDTDSSAPAMAEEPSVTVDTSDLASR